MKFGKNFRELREQCKLSQWQVAKSLGFNQSTISDYENDITRPEYETIFEMAKLYQVCICELLDFYDDNCSK